LDGAAAKTSPPACPPSIEARDLRLPDRVLVLAISRTVHDPCGQAVEVCQTVLAADRLTPSYQLPVR